MTACRKRLGCAGVQIGVCLKKRRLYGVDARFWHGYLAGAGGQHLVFAIANKIASEMRFVESVATPRRHQRRFALASLRSIDLEGLNHHAAEGKEVRLARRGLAPS